MSDLDWEAIDRETAEQEARDAAREQLIEMRAAFDRYASHDRSCLSRKGAHYGEESCDCGFNKARATFLRANEIA